jgi:hypothetical protein
MLNFHKELPLLGFFFFFIQFYWYDLFITIPERVVTMQCVYIYV